MKLSSDPNLRRAQRELLARVYQLVLSDGWGKSEVKEKRLGGNPATIQGNNSNGLERNRHGKE